MFLAQLLLVTSTSSLSQSSCPFHAFVCSKKRQQTLASLMNNGKHEQAWKAWRTCLSCCPQSCGAACSSSACLTSSLTRCESFLTQWHWRGTRAAFVHFLRCLQSACNRQRHTSVFWRLLALIWRSDSVKSKSKMRRARVTQANLLMQYFKWAFLLTWCDIHGIWVLCCSNINAIFKC